MTKRKISTDEKTTQKKKSKKTRQSSKQDELLSTQEAIERFDETVNDLIDLSDDLDDDVTKEISGSNDVHESDSEKEDVLDNSFTPSVASIPVFLSDDEVIDPQKGFFIEMMDSMQNLKQMINQLLLSNKKLTHSNRKLRKSVAEQKKLTKVAITEVIKLKRRNVKIQKAQKKCPKNVENLDAEDAIDKAIRPIISERDQLKEQLLQLQVTRSNKPNYDWESLLAKKQRVLPNWRQLFFKRRDEYKREFKNRSKAEIYDRYKEMNYLPRKFRPKFARSLEEFKVKEKASFETLEATKRCCVLDADQAKHNYNSIDSQVIRKIQDESYNDEEQRLLINQWRKEVHDAEPKAKEICYREITYLNNLPYTEEYNGFIDVNREQTDDIQSNNVQTYSNATPQNDIPGNDEWTTVTPKPQRTYRGRRYHTAPRRNNDTRFGSNNRNYSRNNSHIEPRTWESHNRFNSNEQSYSNSRTSHDQQQYFH